MMPKGFKSQNGYGTTKSLGGLSYHEIARKMTEKGYKMNHSTARNIFVSSLMKIAKEVNDLYEVDNDNKKIAIDPRFQEAVSEFMQDIRYEKK